MIGARPETFSALPGPPPVPVRRTGSLLAGVLVLGALAGAAYTGHRQIDTLQSALDDETLTEATRTLDQLLDRQKDQLAAEVRVLADDNRIRATVLASQFDAPTVQDVIDDLRKSSGATLLAVLDAHGKVQVVTGSGALRQANLGASPKVKEAFTKPTSDVWTLPDQAQVIGLAPIRSGEQTPALLVKGLPLGASQLSTVAATLGVAGAVLIGNEVVATSPGAPDLLEALKRATGLGDGTEHVDTTRGRYLVRVAHTGSGAMSARVAWALPHHHHAEKTRLLELLIWAPVALGVLLFLLLLVPSPRTHGGNA